MTSRCSGLFVSLWVLGLSLSCGTDPVGVEACRKIEQARCEAAVHCGMIEDLAACKRFFRDHCLHGVALEEEPGNVAADGCVSAIRLAGECAEDPKRGPKTPPKDCSKTTFKNADADQICELVEEPERASQCAFLSEVEADEPELDEPASEPDAGK